MSGSITAGAPVVVGHRGAAAVTPENTLASFQRGIADGATVIELDVHLSADGHLVVIHDETVDRTAVGGRTTGAVADLTWAELREVELGSGQLIPSLAEALAVISVGLQVEVKAAAAARATAELVLASDAADRTMVVSFKPEALRVVREVAPDLPVGVISHIPTPAALAAVQDLDADLFAVEIAHLDAALVDDLRADGVDVCGWPVLTEDDLSRALDLGVAMVTVDDPAWCRSLLATTSSSS